MNQHLSFIDSGKAAGGKARVRTGLGKSDRPGSQGGLRKRGTMVGRANPLRYRKRVNGSNSPKVKRAVFLSRPSTVLEGPGPTDVWLKYCGTAGKPGGKLRKQNST
jgi:hypothetical protein